MITTQLLLKISTCLYIAALVADIVFGGRRGPVIAFLLPALAANIVALLFRYLPAWPMMPMYLGPVALPPVLCLLALFIPGQNDGRGTARRIALAFAVIVAVIAVLFPKDFYLPFLKSQSLFAHLFILFGTLGRACFLMGAAWAVEGLAGKSLKEEVYKPGDALNRSFHWNVWGFSFWTLSMFSGELWSYLGWGTPVVWNEPAITTTMAAWFFYICLMHLHLTGTWSAKSRGVYAAVGALIILGLTLPPDLGPFRWPVQL